jgi:hypothetical protein
MPYHFILPEDPPVFPTFTRAVFAHWRLLMSGGVITVLLGVFEKFSGKDIPFSVYIGILILFVFIACFLAWKDARNEMSQYGTELAEKEQEVLDKEQVIIELKHSLLEEKAKHTPQLEAFIDEIATGEIKVKGIKESAVTLKIILTNLGMPSIAKDWMPLITMSGKEPVGFHCLHFPGELTLGFGENGSAIVIKGQDMIYEKTATPIQTGAMIVGYLHFRSNLEVNEIRALSTDVKVLFRDVTGKQCEATFEKDRAISLPEPRYSVGTETKMKTVNKWKNPSKKAK